MQMEHQEIRREIFCLDCGLVYLANMYIEEENGQLRYNEELWDCPNDACPSHDQHETLGRVSTDSTGYSYFAESNADFIRHIAWTSPQYVTDEVLAYYREQGKIQIKG
jgi:hypothetical protein